MTEAELDAFGGSIAEQAIMTIGDPIVTAAVLVQAAIAVLVAMVPGSASAAGIDALNTALADGFRDFLRSKGSVQ